MPRLGGKKTFKKIRPVLKQEQIRCGRERFFDILRESNMLIGKKKQHTRTTQSYHRFYKHPNRIKDKEITRPEEVFVSDITYIKTKEKPMYLSLVTDAYSKYIMGYELSDNLKTESCIRALKMATENRRYPDRELIHHSDRGFQYCSPDYIETLEKNQVQVSMTTKHDPYENAIAERVNGILKSEFDIEGFATVKEAQREIRTAIGTYNYERPHLSCGYLTPWEAHRNGKYKLKKWSRRFSESDMSLSEN